MNDEYVTLVGFGGKGFKYEVHYFNSHDVKAHVQYADEDDITSGYFKYIRNLVEANGYEKAIIFEKNDNESLSEFKVIKNQKMKGVA